MAERPPPTHTATADVTPVVESTEAAARSAPRRTGPAAGGAWHGADFSGVPARSAVGPSARLIERLARTLPTSGGEQLPDRVGQALERSTGLRPPHTARVRNGPASSKAAKALDARAFTTPDGAIHVGPAASPANHDLLLHEAAHTLQQPADGSGSSVRHVSSPGDRWETNARDVAAAARAGRPVAVLGAGAGVIHRDVVSDIKDKLSYGLLDWAITDAEASEAFALLDAVPDADLPGVLTKLGSTMVSRLLDNLPSELKTGPRYSRLVQALGPTATLPYVLDQLQTGLFDWAVTDAEVNQIFNVYANLTPPQQNDFWELLSSRGRLGKLISNVSEAHEALYIRPWVRTLIKGATPAEPNPDAVNLTDPQKTILRTMVQETDSLVTADLLLEVRFNVTIAKLSASKEKRTGDDKQVGTDFSLDQLRKLWVLLEALPPGHVVGNPELDRITHYQGDEGSGVYYGDLNEAAIGDSGTGTRFKDVVRHEVGHGVDGKIGFRSKGEHHKATRGSWVDYSAPADAAKDAATISAAAVSKLATADRAAVEGEMVKVMNDNTKGLAEMKTAIAALPLWNAMAAADRDTTRTSVLADPALRAVVVNRKKNSPWFTSTGGMALGAAGKERIVQESYAGRWTSYAVEARSRRVSDYQFRAPGEWFAEAYVSYYAHGETELGDLSVKDPDTKTWFDANVHNK